jgi:hypothetical protein
MQLYQMFQTLPSLSNMVHQRKNAFKCNKDIILHGHHNLPEPLINVIFYSLGKL